MVDTETPGLGEVDRGLTSPTKEEVSPTADQVEGARRLVDEAPDGGPVKDSPRNGTNELTFGSKTASLPGEAPDGLTAETIAGDPGLREGRDDTGQQPEAGVVVGQTDKPTVFETLTGPEAEAEKPVLHENPQGAEDTGVGEPKAVITGAPDLKNSTLDPSEADRIALETGFGEQPLAGAEPATAETAPDTGSADNIGETGTSDPKVGFIEQPTASQTPTAGTEMSSEGIADVTQTPDSSFVKPEASAVPGGEPPAGGGEMPNHVAAQEDHMAGITDGLNETAEQISQSPKPVAPGLERSVLDERQKMDNNKQGFLGNLFGRLLGRNREEEAKPTDTVGQNPENPTQQQ